MKKSELRQIIKEEIDIHEIMNNSTRDFKEIKKNQICIIAQQYDSTLLFFPVYHLPDAKEMMKLIDEKTVFVSTGLIKKIS